MFQIYVRLVGEVLVDDCILSGIYKLVMNLQILERQGNIVFCLLYTSDAADE